MFSWFSVTINQYAILRECLDPIKACRVTIVEHHSYNKSNVSVLGVVFLSNPEMVVDTMRMLPIKVTAKKMKILDAFIKNNSTYISCKYVNMIGGLWRKIHYRLRT
ncbi:uncharacterized protein LOC113310562 isoform X2 [Papaver somniferum]|uniref:uncharacterized protein LOC113310562 isoform X2 n=1 Tax=Papaver somniferum TaxID=3469 RepID=UPI000E705461|nr:uncharacterized protein LOC113310562 isoform X2 [Papaver somniferum]